VSVASVAGQLVGGVSSGVGGAAQEVGEQFEFGVGVSGAPIGTLKTAGAVGLLFGLIGVPLIGTAAAIGLILFFVCAIYTHVRARDYSPQFALAIGFLSLAVAALVLGLASS